MKIKRNDPCSCGSGKKYKKCCMDKSKTIFTIPIEESPSEFEYINDSSKKLAEVLCKYDVLDITKAVYCLNAWPRNRSALAQALTLNQSLTYVEKFGEEKIDNYSKFTNLFNEISENLQITPYEDLTLCDFGDVQITIDNIAYPIILGTGHEHVFGVMNYIEQLASVTQKELELKDLLNYNKLVINTLFGDDLDNSFEKNEVIFEIPKEDFWIRVNSLFEVEQFKVLKERAYEIMGYQNGPIEMRHFFKYEENRFPLFNASLLIDFYKKLLSIVGEEEYQQHINITIWGILENTFNKDQKSHSRVLIAPKMFNRLTSNPYTNNLFSFMTKINNKILVAINEGDYPNEEVFNAELDLFKDLHKKNELRLGESYYRKNMQGGFAIDINPNMEIYFLRIKPLTNVTTYTSLFKEKSEGFICTALDLIYFLYSIKDFEELIEFIDYIEKETAKLFMMGGKSSLYFSWKDSNQQLSSGAIDYNFISIPYGTADDYIYKYYKENLNNYPFSIDSYMFSNHYEWHVSNGEGGYSTIVHKGLLGFGGEIKKFGISTFLFLANNLEFFRPKDLDINNYNSIRVIEELNQRLFNCYGEMIFKNPFFYNKIIQIMYMPFHYAEKVDNNGFTKRQDIKYVYSDINVMNSSIIIRYTVNLDTLMQDIMNSKNREVECNYLNELIQPLEIYIGKYFEIIKNEIFKDIGLPKQVGVFSIEQDYYISDRMINFRMDSVGFAKVRKTIAQVCFESGVHPGQYKGKEATKVIRKMQQTLIRIFEDRIKDFSQKELHLTTLTYYSDQLHQSIVNLKRYSSFKDIDPQILNEFETNTRKEREKNRRNIRTAQYFLETNLSINHTDKNLICDKAEFEKLLAFADWLVVLQDNADNCHYTELDVEIHIDSEYKVDTIFSEYSNAKYEDLFRRKYEQVDYTHKNDDQDKQYLLNSVHAFNIDTGIEFSILISLLEYLQFDITSKTFSNEVAPNIFEVETSELYRDFISLLEFPCEIEQVEKALGFITLDTRKLKCLNGTEHPILPFWEREKRNNRFDIKPVLSLGDTIILSTVLVNQLGMLWKNGIMDWYLPYEIGLDNLRKEIKNWKKRYEDEMVIDIANMFNNAKFDYVFTDFELYKRYPKSSYPQELGDYDVFAINSVKKEIWLIESKVLQKVGSIYEDQMQQKSFFFQHKDDEKFQRRIDYIVSNYSKVLVDLGIPVEKYKIVPYMVTNKLFASRYKMIDFQIISYHELAKII
ncbi:hypothetical protein ABIA69_002698 [Lysinibacillus parviboronicapiens]|uniref:SEC-C motif-containing protein n=1 Tax=Lysinibacillus parviboronicapiens TaxID=436516 RepID=A0ABV2PKS0_9BACI